MIYRGLAIGCVFIVRNTPEIGSWEKVYDHALANELRLPRRSPRVYRLRNNGVP
jgi:hypothetical protein